MRRAELNRRVQVTATKSWPNSYVVGMGAEVDSQVAAPAELRTPNLHRANHRSQKSADGRMATEAEGLQIRPLDGNGKTCLTRTGLLMEGLGSGFRGPVLVFKLPQWSSRTTYNIEQFCGRILSQYSLVNKRDLTRKQMSSVPCPTCGVPAGKRCLLYSGGLRFEPHLIRKLSAAAALERK
jgi:hypothetical protein